MPNLDLKTPAAKGRLDTERANRRQRTAPPGIQRMAQNSRIRILKSNFKASASTAFIESSNSS